MGDQEDVDVGRPEVCGELDLATAGEDLRDQTAEDDQLDVSSVEAGQKPDEGLLGARASLRAPLVFLHRSSPGARLRILASSSS